MKDNSFRKKKPSASANRDVKKLHSRVLELVSLPEENWDGAVCDIIDLGGFALPVLLDQLPNLPKKVQKCISVHVENYIFVYPDKGKKIVNRLIEAIAKSDSSCHPYLVSAIADVSGRGEVPLKSSPQISKAALKVLKSDADFLRKGKAVEIISLDDDAMLIFPVLQGLATALRQVESFSNFNFAETALFALKRMGGEGFMRLMINPQSPDALAQFKLEWRNRTKDEINSAMGELNSLDEGLPQLILKVIELSEVGSAFFSMIQEGLKHTDKWVRQIATSSISKIKDSQGFEQISRMLQDPALEVKMMAVSSLGNFPISRTGDILFKIAQNEGENLEIRMNALYALFSQKNGEALSQLSHCQTTKIAVNAKGLAALLLPRYDGFPLLISTLKETPPNFLPELFHYIMEISVPEDLAQLVAFYEILEGEAARTNFLEFLSAFLENKAGPNLEKALNQLSEGARIAIRSLISPSKKQH